MNKTALIDGIRVISTTELGARIGLAIPGTKVIRLCGVHPYADVAQGTYWREDDLPLICRKLASHLMALADAYQ